MIAKRFLSPRRPCSAPITIHHSDGTYLAKVVGARLFDTPEAKKAGLVLKHPDKRTVCELSGKTLFEMERTDATALKTSAELFTPRMAGL